MSDNATVTVAYKGTKISFELDGTELSVSGGTGTPYHYLTNASRGFIADKVEEALKSLIWRS